ncbi:alpha/beta hydrolase [Nonlabens arenilitoris]|uniref:Alpha/beta hydrolase n=1 Tax=Nonlabens arenilitoris TaxID=1217969 RepID=A0A2S7UBI1_9FLAO|nr:alpha/beta hydrolase [Nonlabens arenilitoris]PQJ31990.1 alpha/beta hydrolase [Nonlabens arenilitoris]
MKQFLQKAIPKLYGFYFNVISLFSKKKAAQLALEVFSTPRRGRILEHQAPFLNTARQQRITSEDCLYMLYHWKGNGPTVLLNHGWESNAFRWKYLFDDLKRLDLNIIAVDGPAHGNSSGKLFTAIKYSKVIKSTIELYEPEIIISHSVGAMATIYNEYHHPSPSLKKLILLGGPNSLETIMQDYQRLLSFNNRVYNGLNATLKEKFGYEIEKFNAADFAVNIEANTLLLHAQQDAIVPCSASKAIAGRMKNAIYIETQTGGHSLHTEENTKHILDFLSKA